MKQIRKVAVIGSGIMGHGIALVSARNGLATTLIDAFPEALNQAKINISNAVDSLVKQQFINAEEAKTILEHIEYTVSLEEGVKDKDIIFEAIPEKLDLKASLYKQLDNFSSPETIVATNTSGLSINQLAGLTLRPEYFIGTHFFMPAYLIPLVEVIEGEKTHNEVTVSVMNFLSALGKAPVRVCKDIPGFIANRLQHALAREAMSLVQKGVASIEDIDTVVKTSLAVRLLFTGPLEQRDFNGLDTHLSIAEYLYKDLEDSKKPLPILVEKIKEGCLGIKSGKGFYDWTGRDIAKVIQNKNHQLIEVLRLAGKN